MQSRKLRCDLRQFVCPSDSDYWLTLLRVGLALQLLFYCLSLRSDWFQLFASEGRGLISRDLTEAIVSVDTVLTPRLGWIAAVGNYLGLNQYYTLWFVWWCLTCGALCLLAGILCRSAAVLVWFLHVCTSNSAAVFSYGVDNLTSIGLFYLML